MFVGGPAGESRQMMSAKLARGAEIAIDTPATLFDIDANVDVPRGFDVMSDGTRFLMIRRAETATSATRWVVVQNWMSEIGSAR
jgi:hypothetical protein